MAALEHLERGPLRDLVSAAGETLTLPAAGNLTRLGTALDAVVNQILDEREPSPNG
jgi:hypothetical protein